LQVADFGTRRRFSYRVQEEVVNVLKHDFPGASSAPATCTCPANWT
jgi:nicotinic acid phosphoribosyltransferase